MSAAQNNEPSEVQRGIDSIVLEEEIDPNYVPTEDEVVEYAKWLGMDLEKDKDMFWIAREGLMAPLPKNWKPCKTKDTEDIYYFNFVTGVSTWDHPCDEYYKRLYDEEKKKKELALKDSSNENKTKAKQDVEILLGKSDKKKKRSTSPSSLSQPDIITKKESSQPLKSLEKKPLPHISLKVEKEISPVELTSSNAISKSKLSTRLQGVVDAESNAKEVDPVDSSKSFRDKEAKLNNDDLKPQLAIRDQSILSTKIPTDKTVTFNLDPDVSSKFNRHEQAKADGKESQHREPGPTANENDLISMLNNEIASLNKKFRIQSEEKNRVIDEQNILEKELGALKRLNSQLEFNLQAVKGENLENLKIFEETKNKLRQAESKIDQLRRESQDEINSLQLSLQCSKDKCATLNVEIEDLKSQLFDERCKKTMTTESVLVSTYEVEMQTLRSTLQRVMDSNNSLVAEIAKLNYEKTLCTIPAHLQNYSANPDDKNYAEIISNLETKLKRSLEHAQDLENLNHNILSDIKEKDLSLKALEREVEMLTNQLGYQDSQIKEYFLNNTLIQTKLDKLTSEISSPKNNTADNLSKSIVDLKDKLAQSELIFKTDKSRLEDEVEKEKSKNLILANRVGLLESQISNKTIEDSLSNSSISPDLSKLSLELERATKLLVFADSDLKESFNLTASLQRSNRTLHTDIDNLKEELENERINLKKSKELCSTLTAKVEKLENELSLKSRQIAKLKEEAFEGSTSLPNNPGKESDNSELELQLRDYENKFSSLTIEVERLKSENNSLEVTLDLQRKSSTAMIQNLQSEINIERELTMKLKFENKILKTDSYNKEQDLRLSLSKLESSQKALELDLKEKQLTIDLKNSEINRLKETISLLEENNSLVNINDYKNLLDAKYQEILSLRQENLSLQHENSNFKEKFSEFSELTVSHTGPIFSLGNQKAVEEYKNKYLTSMEQISILLSEKNKAIDDINELKGQLAALDVENSVKLKDLEDKLRMTTMEHNNTKTQLQKCLLDSDTKDNQIEVLKSKLAKCESDLKEALLMTPRVSSNNVLRDSTDSITELNLKFDQQKAVIEKIESKVAETEKLLESIGSSTKQKSGKFIQKQNGESQKVQPDQPSKSTYSDSDLPNMYSENEELERLDYVEQKIFKDFGNRLQRERSIIAKIEDLQLIKKRKLIQEMKDVQYLREEWKSSRSLNKKISSADVNSIVATLNKSIKCWRDVESFLKERKSRLEHIEQEAAMKGIGMQSDKINRMLNDYDEMVKRFGFASSDDNSELEFVSDVFSPPTKTTRRSKSVPHFHSMSNDYKYFASDEEDSTVAPVSVQLNIPKSMSHPNNQKRIRKELEDLSNNHRKRINAYDQHSHWLESLNRELGSYQITKENVYPKSFSTNLQSVHLR